MQNKDFLRENLIAPLIKAQLEDSVAADFRLQEVLKRIRNLDFPSPVIEGHIKYQEKAAAEICDDLLGVDDLGSFQNIL